MNKAKAAAFFCIEVTDPNGHLEWNWWHSSDHIPENLALDGVALGTRWIAPKTLMDARMAVHPGLARTQYLVHYLFKDPVEQSLTDFSALGAQLRAVGRMYEKTDIPLAATAIFLKGFVAPRIEISPEALPYRPHKGILAIMVDFEGDKDHQESSRWFDRVHVPDMLTVKGITGAYWFQGRPKNPRYHDVGDPEKRWTFLYYLDEDPLQVVIPDLMSKYQQWKAAGRTTDTRPGLRTVLAAPYLTITDPRHCDWRKV